MYPKCIFHSNVNVSQKLIRPIVILTQIYERATYEVAVSKFAIRSLHLTSLSVFRVYACVKDLTNIMCDEAAVTRLR